jgi:hypothetical protein
VATFGRFFPKKREGIYNRIIYFENIFQKMAKIHPTKIITGPNSVSYFSTGTLSKCLFLALVLMPFQYSNHNKDH